MFKTIEECGLDLVTHTGDDWMPVRAARASFGKQDKTGENIEADRKLMRYLAEHGHTSCFEHQSATFLLEVPLFIRSQIHRHRTFSYNEISRRYTEERIEFWKPTTWRKQSSSNKQASSDEVVDPSSPMFGEWISSKPPTIEEQFVVLTKACRNNYEELLKAGVTREQARAVLPQSLLTQFYMTGNLRNWQHFVKLRTDTHAQYEIQVVANRISEKLASIYPESWKNLMEYL